MMRAREQRQSIGLHSPLSSRKDHEEYPSSSGLGLCTACDARLQLIVLRLHDTLQVLREQHMILSILLICWQGTRCPQLAQESLHSIRRQLPAAVPYRTRVAADLRFEGPHALHAVQHNGDQPRIGLHRLPHAAVPEGVQGVGCLVALAFGVVAQPPALRQELVHLLVNCLVPFLIHRKDAILAASEIHREVPNSTANRGQNWKIEQGRVHVGATSSQDRGWHVGSRQDHVEERRVVA
mmetsp:Transcript_54054/g.129219  ORF Transcript_54054/g.129219 Transcript_54054/m.129219 type:complete len:238 (-) Transcript_54054:337-1050(-)